eukprot:COSAG06_NODE_23402_length_693_cov_0.508418_1_plen_86_part_00
MWCIAGWGNASHAAATSQGVKIVAASAQTSLSSLTQTHAQVKEFAAESQFKNPCRGFTLPDVICANCNFRYCGYDIPELRVCTAH